MPPASPALRRSSYSPGSACALASCRASAHERARSGPKTSSGPLGRESALIVWAVTSSSLVSLRDHQAQSGGYVRRVGGYVLESCLPARPSHVAGLHQAQSGPLTLNQAPSGAITLNQAPSGAITLNQAPSGAITLNQAPSGAITLNQAPSGRAYQTFMCSSRHGSP